MAHLHEMNNPKTPIDAVGWLFTAFIVAVTAIAGTVCCVIAATP
jgi:hypothetical protein